ncbi:hypothetical protein LUZ61_012366 [Rhynchospora tenuis]|uniref:Uncharacterized protein n=1 Tax=Rhynchospora tenuis TaxID=198213 RepID=A0AAD6A2T2_9POAL|nr:hypothetical protein LUZ61_012366 [Rhynchospora tenuis]
MGEEKGGVVVVEEEGMQCSKHPYKSNPNPGGICAFCLQEKLGKLVSSSNSASPFFPLHPPPSSNNSSPPSFRSVNTTVQTNTNTSSSSSSYSSNVKSHRSRSSRISSFLMTSSASSHSHHYKKKHQPPKSGTSSSSSAAVAAAPALNLKRTKSVAPKPVNDNTVNPATITMDSPRKKSFWSFLYLSSSTSTGASASPNNTATVGASTGNAAAMRRRSVSSFSSGRGHGHLGSTDEEGSMKRDAHLGAVMGEDESPSPGGSQSQASSSSFGRKVARSRSVGCGSRSFSGDFLERLSNGFGDCTLRRVESHRESHSSKPSKMVLPGQLEDDDDDCVEAHRMRIRCSGFFGSSSSSSYWLSTAADNGARMSTGGVGRSHRGWGWAFASPMRAFKPPTSSASSVKSMPSSSHLKVTNGISDLPQSHDSTLTTPPVALPPPPVGLS